MWTRGGCHVGIWHKLQWIAGVVCLVLLGGVQDSSAQQMLENPKDGSFQSGISIISGWVCAAQRVQIRVDTALIDAVYGTPRGDTQGVCKDTNNGFSVQVNWNELNEGTHTVALCVDGVCGSSVSVVVTSYGPSFLRGFDGLAIVACTNNLSPAFPTSTVFTWQESLQNWTIGLTPTCTEVSNLCAAPLPDPAGRRLCADLLNCCRTQ